MKYLKTSALALAAVFAMGNLASAETVTVTGIAYGTTLTRL